MTDRFSAFLYVVLVALCGFSHGARACMPDKDDFGTTNFELVQLADAIVVATPQSEKRIHIHVDQGDWVTTQTVFRVDQVLKGNTGADLNRVTLDLILGKTEPSDPNDILSSHPEAAEGSCNRQRVEKGRPYVLFLHREDDGQFSWLRRYPYTRVAEDYYGEDSLWVSTIRFYLDVQKEPDPRKQFEILKHKYESLVANKEMSDRDMELALDIKIQIGAISPSMPTEFLIESFNAIEEGRKSRFAVQEEDKRLSSYRLKKLRSKVDWDIDESDLATPEVSLDEQKSRVLEAFLGEGHEDAMVFFDEILKKPGQSPLILAAVARYYSQYGRYHDALEILKDHAFEAMNMGTEGEAAAFLKAVIAVDEVPGDYKRKKWQDDPEVKAWWPKMSFGIYSAYVNRFLRDDRLQIKNSLNFKPEVHFEQAAKELRPKDYRAWPELAIYLASHTQDDPVLDWAAGEIDRYIQVVKKNEKAKYNQFERFYLDLPALVLLESYNDKQEQFDRIQKYFCSDKDVRETFLKQLGLVRGYTDDMLLVYRFSHYEGYNTDEQKYLNQSIAALAGRNNSIIFYGMAPFIHQGPFDYELPEEGLGKTSFKCAMK